MLSTCILATAPARLALRSLQRQTLVAAVIWVSLLAIAPAYAAIFTVTSHADAPDAVRGDGICATLQGVCTLRAAIQEANALPGVDTINLPRGVYPLTAGELAITDDLVLAGAGSATTAINNTRQARVMSTASATTVTIAGVRLQRGQADAGAGLLNNGTATLNDVGFAGNRAVSAAGGTGGGVDNTGTLTLSNTTFTRNRATGAGGGFGGGIYNSGTVTIADVTFADNFTSGCGGAVFNDGGTLTLTRTSITANRAGSSGGGVFNQSGTLELSAATLARNRATQIGGGIFTYAPATLTNVTISANHAKDGAGLFSQYASAVVRLVNVTVSNNRALSGGGFYADSTATNVPSVTLHNTLVAFNQPDNCVGTTVTSLGHNLDSGTTCGLIAAGDLNNTDPTLGALRNNGGPTKTCAFLPGSPAIDAGDNSGCPATDERGDPRPAGEPAVCDIGAYEAQP